MSKIGKRKQLNRAHTDVCYPTEDQTIAKVLMCPGNNLYEVLTPSGDQILASLPTVFRKSVMLVRGDYVLLQPIEENDKVKAEIVTIYMKTQVKHMQKEGVFPKEFSDQTLENNSEEIYDFVNSNHQEDDNISTDSSSSEED